jgi:thioredoxin 1
MGPIMPRTRLGNSEGRAGLVLGMDNMKHFDGPDFEADVLKASEPVVVDFYADWCGPCRMMTPVVEQLAVEYAGKVTIGKLDVDVNQDIAIRYGVMGIPTLGLFREGKLVDRLVGYPGGAGPIKAWIDRNVTPASDASVAEKAATN